MLDKILSYNKQFVKEKGCEQYMTGKYPDKKIATLTCMDTRLVELLPAALGLKNGDVKIIKNAGAVISNPFGSVVRSLLQLRRAATHGRKPGNSNRYRPEMKALFDTFS